LRLSESRPYNRAMLTGTRIAFIGGGNMAEALLAGLLRKGVAVAEHLTVSDPDVHRRELLAERFGVAVHADNRTAAQGAELVVILCRTAGARFCFG
jgi:pyrroline-5-carboxylate reductase